MGGATEEQRRAVGGGTRWADVGGGPEAVDGARGLEQGWVGGRRMRAGGVALKAKGRELGLGSNRCLHEPITRGRTGALAHL